MSNRDNYIDLMRTICTIGIIFIHTVFWSGESYCPKYIQSLSLLIDVPAFFFITGCVLTRANINSNLILSQIYKLSLLFTFVVIILQFLSLSFNLKSIISSIFLICPSTPQFVVVAGSYWFIPVYVTSLILSVLIIKYYERFISAYLSIVALVFISKLPYPININMKFLGIDIFYTIFYSCFILLGYKIYNLSLPKKKWLLFATLCSLLTLVFFLFKGNFIMQDYKFPPSFVYFIYSMILIFIFMAYKQTVPDMKILYIGRNAIYFYASQGISSSLCFHLVNTIQLPWPAKLAIIFPINLCLAICIGIILKKLFNKALQLAHLPSH